MTREEIVATRQYQLTDAAIEYCRKEHPHHDGETLGEITDAFEAGAEWGHKYLIEKVKKYLREYIILYVWATDLGKREVWFDDFRKAMKE